MGAHAILSASGSHKWLHCTPSARLEEQFENTSSIFALEGTAAHELAEHKLRTYLGIESIRPTSDFDGDELEKYTDIYVEFAKELITQVKQTCNDPIILLEQRLDFSCFVPEGFGTGDLVVVADGTLDIIDLKYGKGVMVSAVSNPQMMLYALGAYSIFESLYDIHTVRMTICQPRVENISTYEMTIEELLNWAEIELKPKAILANEGKGEFLPGEHCRFCRAKATCGARAKEILGLAKFEFKEPGLLTDEQINEVLSVADKVSRWVNDVFSYATDCSVHLGTEWNGYKLVEGKTNRKYKNEKAVLKICEEHGLQDIYKQSLISITAMEKYLGKTKFQDLLGHLVTKPEGKPTLVPVTDKRSTLKTTQTAIADFKGEM